MEEKIKLPDMGEGVESAVVARLLVREGDNVQIDQGIVELETEKAVAEVPSPKAGKVKQVHVKADQEVRPGELLVTLEVEGEGEKIEEGPAKPIKQKGEKPQAAPQKPQAKAAKKARPQAEEKEEAPEQAAEEETPKEEEGEAEGEQEPAAATGRLGEQAADIPAAPSVRRLARELGVDLRGVAASGEGGWISEADVKAAARSAGEARAPLGEADQWGAVRREKMRQLRKTAARHMRQAKDTAAHVTHFCDADVTELEAFRKEHKKDFAAEGIELTMLAFVARAVADALKAHPLLNASLDMDRGEIIYKQYVSIGIAVDSDRGLVVPVLRNADCLSVAEAAKAIGQIAERARENKLEAAELRGGTFSISNLGSIGGRYATPIINVPESAVLLTGRSAPQAVVRDGAVVIRTMLPLSLTYDHRLIDGAEAQRFLNDIIAFLENPAKLLTR